MGKSPNGTGLPFPRLHQGLEKLPLRGEPWLEWVWITEKPSSDDKMIIYKYSFLKYVCMFLQLNTDTSYVKVDEQRYT